ncbi:hypothetical protein HR060_17435 [Catenovulum sp. SM1970]|uniref:hypothetical protein n=1 Tax=Marinifaba aquimaris TaxID=2741323 RepID=UPI001574636B|nr:hypothetical protein [Marinifaba aquimaris]NTS78629.1 hypothetical protein [Marinifaba aquimaris]
MFRQKWHDHLRQTLFSVALFLMFFGPIVVIFGESYVIAEHIIEWMFLPLLAFSIYIVSVSYKVVRSEHNPYDSDAFRSQTSKWLFPVKVAFICFFLNTTLHFGFGYLLHLSLASATTEVTWVLDKYHTKQLDRCLRLESFQDEYGVLCKRPLLEWNEVHIGQRVEVKYSHSFLGKKLLYVIPY